MRLEGSRILVTGAARGIGLAVVRGALAEGARVLACDIDADVLTEAADQIAEGRQRLICAEIDVGEPNSVATIPEILADWPALDGLVNNAAMLDISDAGTVSDSRFAEVLNVNLTGALRVTRTMLPFLRKSRSPAIVNTLSTQSFFAVPRSAAYATAKGGLQMLTRSMAVDFGAEGIRANAVAPGFVNTRMALTDTGAHEHEMEDFTRHYIEGGRIPLRRPGTPEDCVGAFLFLLSDHARYITGQTICVDGGLTATY